MKICSLIPSGTEMLFALGLGDQVIGVTEYCNYPPVAKTKRVVSKGGIDIYHMSAREVDEKVQELASAGKSAYIFDTEWLKQVKPDLVLTQNMCKSCDIDAKDVFCAIEDIDPKPTVLVLNPRRLSDILVNIERVGKATRVPEEAASLVTKLQNRIRRVRELVSTTQMKPRTLYLEWTDPPSPAGDWIPEQIEIAGGIAQLGEAGVAPSRLNWKVMEECDPEVIFVGPCSHNISRSLKEMPNVARVDAWWRLGAVRSSSTYIVNSEYFDRPGPRVVDGIEILAQVLHPELDICEIPPNAVVRLRYPGSAPARPEEVVDLYHPYKQEPEKHEVLQKRAEMRRR